jgi:hypothetical protein
MRTGHGLRRRCIVLGVLLLVTAPWSGVARADSGDQPTAIVWGDNVFSSRADLAAWLASRGATYGRWARLHPEGRAIVEHRALPSAPTVVVPLAAAQHAVSISSPSGVEILLLVVAASMMLLALMPVLRVSALGDARLTATHRTYLFAFGFTICIAVLFAATRG